MPAGDLGLGSRALTRRGGGALLAAIALLVAACGQGSASSRIPDDAFAAVVNADVAVGSQRLLVGLLTPDGGSHAAPDLEVEIDLFPPGSSEASISVPGEFVWAEPEVAGFYRARVELGEAGTWSVAIRAGGRGPGTLPMPFAVAEEGITPSVGDRAPSVATATASTPQAIAEISTDPTPNPRFYEESLDAALRSGRPTVVVFSTPAFCETAVCGPMLNNVKQVAPEFGDVNFIHVEVYANLDVTSREELRVAEAVETWRLPSEPWVFVVDGGGLVSAKFEGTLDPDELRDVLEDIT